MGKAKKRSLHLGINNRFSCLTREQAVTEVVRMLNNGKCEDIYSLITLFGLGAEEILEAGASYESVKSLENILS